MEKKYSSTLENIQTIAAQIVADFSAQRIFTFSGNLGAGKTTLIRAICETLGCVDETSSPSYAIINEYHTEKEKIYHLDLYRLKNIDEALEIGIEDILSQQQYCFIEWASVIEPILQNYETVFIEITPTSENTRIISARLN